MRFRKFVFVLVLISSGLLHLSPARAEGPLSPTLFDLWPGVLVDTAKNRGYLMAPGGIEALELSTGQPLWKTSLARKPLAIGSNRLLAQAETTVPGSLRLEILDTDTGKRMLGREIVVSLPARVLAALQDGMGRIDVRQAVDDFDERHLLVRRHRPRWRARSGIMAAAV